MKITRPDLAAMAVCIIAVIGLVVLSAIHGPIPDVLPTIALIALSAGVGVATQTVTTLSPPQALSEPVTVPAVIPAQPTAPALETTQPTATHAP